MAGRYPPLWDYAVIADGRTGRFGRVHRLVVPPYLDSPSVFAAILHAERGGRFTLHPRHSHAARCRYLPDTNVLETTLTAPTGVVRATDAMTLTG